MARKYTLSYLEFVNESEDGKSPEGYELKGYSANEIIERLRELVKVLPDKVRFGIPPDNLGRNITYMDLNGIVQRILNIEKHYSMKNENVSFYCWSVAFAGTPSSSEALRAKIENNKEFGKYKTNLNLKMMIDYFTNNREDSDNLGSISIGIDSPTIRKEMESSSEEKPVPTEQPSQEQPKSIEG